jgi:hypothetical protein
MILGIRSAGWLDIHVTVERPAKGLRHLPRKMPPCGTTCWEVWQACTMNTVYESSQISAVNLLIIWRWIPFLFIGALAIHSFETLINCIITYSSVDIVTRQRDGRKINRSSIPGRGKSLLFSITSRPVLGPTQFFTQWLPADILLGIMWQRRKIDNSLPPSAQVKNCGATPPLPILLHDVVLN